MAKRSNRRDHFRPTIFKIMETEDKLTAASGLSTIIEVYDQSPMSEHFHKVLPHRSTANNRSGGSYRLGLIQLESFIFGHDCLDDLEEFRDDPMLAAQMKGETVAPRTMGDFLGDFEERNTDGMNDCLSVTSRTIRRFLREVLPPREPDQLSFAGFGLRDLASGSRASRARPPAGAQRLPVLLALRAAGLRAPDASAFQIPAGRRELANLVNLLIGKFQR